MGIKNAIYSMLNLIKHVNNPADCILNYLSISQKLTLSCKSGLKIDNLSREHYRWLGTLGNLCLLSKIVDISVPSENEILVNDIKIPIADIWVINTYLLIITKLGGNLGINNETNRPYVEFSINDRLIHFDLPDHINGWGVIVDTYINRDYDVFDVSRKIVVDIGAYIGDTSLFFALNGARRVYGFEPHPLLYKLGEYNVKINKLDNVIKLKNAGVGSQNQHMLLEVDKSHLDSSGYVSRLLESKVEYMIQVIDILEIFESVGTVDILKLDCEGCEFEILKRLHNAGKLDDLREGLVMEVHERADIGYLNEILSILKKEGFRYNIYKSFENSNLDLDLYLLKAWRV